MEESNFHEFWYFSDFCVEIGINIPKTAKIEVIIAPLPLGLGLLLYFFATFFLVKTTILLNRKKKIIPKKGLQAHFRPFWGTKMCLFGPYLHGFCKNNVYYHISLQSFFLVKIIIILSIQNILTPKRSSRYILYHFGVHKCAYLAHTYRYFIKIMFIIIFFATIFFWLK